MPNPTSDSAQRLVKGTGTRGSGPDPEEAGVRVLCVDDHAVLIEGLRAQFSIDNRIGIVGCLPSAERLLEEAARLKPDVVLLDIEMPGPDAFEMADRLRHIQPKIRVIFLSAHIRDAFISAAYKCGAWGYFAKGDDLDDIAAGVREVARSPAGTFVLGPKVRQRCRPTGNAGAARKEGDPGAPSTALEQLTPREIEVLRLMGKGKSRTEIAAELCRSAKTIDGHRERIMKKLRVSSSADLMRFAIREGLAQA